MNAFVPLSALLMLSATSALFAENAKWGELEIRASHIEFPHKQEDVTAPVFNTDPLNLFLVVESGGNHVTVLDGNTFESIHRFASRSGLHGGPEFSSDGRYAFFVSRDGWVSKFDIHKLIVTAETRVGIHARNAAVSNDDKYLLVANHYPHSLVVLSADDLSLIKIISVDTGKGQSSRVSAVHNAATRNTFVAALKDAPQIWEINYEDPAPAGFGQPWTHDYRQDSGDAITELFPVRRLHLDFAIENFFLDQDDIHVIGSSSDGRTQAIDLDLGRSMANLELSGVPHQGSGITWKYKDTMVLATPHLKENSISFIDMASWKVVKKIPTAGIGYFLHSHAKTPYAWADVSIGHDRDIIYVIDKQKLEVVKTLRPKPGKTSTHVEFTRDGSHALVSIRETQGAVIVYDTKTLDVVKRIPMKKPAGTYNIYNRMTHSSGINH